MVFRMLAKAHDPLSDVGVAQRSMVRPRQRQGRRLLPAERDGIALRAIRELRVSDGIAAGKDPVDQRRDLTVMLGQSVASRMICMRRSGVLKDPHDLPFGQDVPVAQCQE